MSVSCESCVLSSRRLYDEPIPCLEESYRLWCVIECDLDISRKRWPWPALDCFAIDKHLLFSNVNNKMRTEKKILSYN